MTISPQCFTSTDTLIRPCSTKFYPVKIPVLHHQLRHLISVVGQDWIYYADEYNIFIVHIPSRRKGVLATVHFEPRCIAAGIGWVCAGGDNNGDSAFIRVNDDARDQAFQVQRDISRKPQAPQSRQNQDDCEAFTTLILEELGGDIVNSITLHEMPSPGATGGIEPVALLSNNDKTVKIYSLSQQRVIADLHHPFPVNYALISPDSKTLVTVGDSSQAYFYRRKSALDEPSSENYVAKCDWQIQATPNLACRERRLDDHSFSIAFSPSGHLCAVSAQGGMISVFDMNIIDSLVDPDTESYEDAMVCSFASSRPEHYGFIRSMAFSPAPWDLLAWAEDHGRGGLADLQQALCRRQIFKLNMNAPQTEKVTLVEVGEQDVKDHDSRGRLMLQDKNESSLNLPEDWAGGLSLQEQSSRRPGVSSDLDTREQSILDTLNATVDIFHNTNEESHRYSVNYQISQEISPPIPSQVPIESLIDVFRERNLQLLHGNERHHPRRRNSVVLSQSTRSGMTGQSILSPDDYTRPRITASPVRMDDANTTTNGSRLPTSWSDTPNLSGRPSTEANTQNIPPSDSWHVLQTAFAPPTHVLSHYPGPELVQSSPDRGSGERSGGGRATSLLPAVSRPVDQTSAQTSTLPTTLSSYRAQTPSRQHAAQYLLRQGVPLSELETERQIRRLTSTSSEVGASASRPRSRSTSTEEPRLRTLNAPPHPNYRLAEQEVGTSSPRSNPPSRSFAARRPEFAGRPAPSHWGLTRQHMTYRITDMVDGNGNWIGRDAMRVNADQSGGRYANNGSGGDAPPIAEIEVGTTGVGWSDDGRKLYMGTEDGIFEYTMNLTRKTFPALDLR